jgi:hypothetical protein
MSGSGPSVFARPEGEQPVEGVRNPEDGQCRASGWPGTYGSLRLTSLKGRETPGGATRSCWTGEGIAARTLRGR